LFYTIIIIILQFNMSNQLEDVYDIVLKWGTIYSHESSNLMFMNKLMYESGQTFIKRKLVNHDGTITESVNKLLGNFIRGRKWDNAVQLLKRLKDYDAKFETISIKGVRIQEYHRRVRGYNKLSDLPLKCLLDYYFEDCHRAGCRLDTNVMLYFINLLLDLGISEKVVAKIVKLELDYYVNDYVYVDDTYILDNFEEQHFANGQSDTLYTVGMKYLKAFRYRYVMREFNRKIKDKYFQKNAHGNIFLKIKYSNVLEEFDSKIKDKYFQKNADGNIFLKIKYSNVLEELSNTPLMRYRAYHY